MSDLKTFSSYGNDRSHKKKMRKITKSNQFQKIQQRSIIKVWKLNIKKWEIKLSFSLF